VHETFTKSSGFTNKQMSDYLRGQKYVALIGAGAICVFATAGGCGVVVVASLGVATPSNAYDAFAMDPEHKKYKQFFIAEALDAVTALSSLYLGGGVIMKGADLSRGEELFLQAWGNVPGAGVTAGQYQVEQGTINREQASGNE
jgi:hypothetical protein